METILEVCCGSYSDARTAYEAGAKRIELNSALAVDGLTPTVSCLRMIKRKTNLEVNCMVRPRGAGFFYDRFDCEQMVHEARDLLENGADGIVFGYLDEDMTLNNLRIFEMTALVHSYGKRAIFSRAFDVLDDPMYNIEVLIDAGCDGLLTSGCRRTAEEGIETIARMNKKYGHFIEIVAGSGVNEHNVRSIVETTGVHVVHSSCKTFVPDVTTSSQNVSFAYRGDEYQHVCADKVREMLQVMKAE